MAEQPQIFEERQGHPALLELDDLYLGQQSEAARQALREYCEHPVRRDSTRMGSEAYFLGCRLTDGETIQYVRVGFWPKIDDRVATLEYKRETIPPAAVHQRYLEFADGDLEETLKPHSIRISSAEYRLFADWDDGEEGPTHIIVGFSPHIPKAKTHPTTND